MKQLDWQKIQQLIDDKYISMRKHNTLPLRILNYTPKAQYDRYWTEETEQCRGLIIDKNNTIIARPFKKFYNVEEFEQQGKQLPVENFEVFEKIDGSLGILYWDGDEPYLATRGSFTSDQAIKGTEILRKKLREIPDLIFDKAYTYLFEIIFPANRIVVDYGKTEDVFLLAVINTTTGTEKSYTDMRTRYEGKLKIAKRYDGIADYREFVKEQKENSEGYVIRFTSGLRTKIKFSGYIRLHRLLTNVTARTIWEALRTGESLETLYENVPDEFYSFVQETAQKLRKEYQEIDTKVCTIFIAIEEKNFPGDMRVIRKQKAIEYMKHPQYRGLLFLLLDGRDYSDAIWEMIRPEAEKPFNQQLEDI